MNMPIKPSVLVQGDRNDRIMSRSGDLVGLSKTRAVWRYGFLPESDAARAYGVSVSAFYWVIAKYNGDVLATFEGFAIELPARFKEVIESKL